MVARFFVDENDLALGKALAAEHDDVVFPGHPDLPEVSRQMPDDDWLPIIGSRRLVVITRDQRIRYRPVEKRAWVTHRVRGFVLTGRRSQSTADSKAILTLHWETIISIVTSEAEGPWMRAVTSSGSERSTSASETEHDPSRRCGRRVAVLYGRFVVPATAGGVRLPSGRWQPEQVLGRKVVAKTRADGSVAEPIAAFDVTFSPSKSVSVLWGLTTDDKVRQTVVEAHETAVAAGLTYLDATAGHTRAGDGGVRKVAGGGFVIAQFRHRSSRSTDPGSRVGDPQLHSHCAILNRVRGVDGTWRTLDSRAIYRHAHAAGAVYGAMLERELSERFGVSWATPDRGSRCAKSPASRPG